MTPPIPKEALAYFKRKGLKVSFIYADVWKEEHDLQFTVAKITQLDVLNVVRDSLEQALRDGTPYAEWRKRLRPELEKKGWWKAREAVDETTGEIGTSHLGAPGRLRVTYETNMRQAYNAGQQDRIERTKNFLPYLLRTVGPSVEHRPEHLAWHGTLLPADDAWWPNHPCPGGYGCKCINRQVGRVEYARLVKEGVPGPGVRELDAAGLPTGRLIRSKAPPITKPKPDQMIRWRNKRTGKVDLVPKGIDPSFAYQAGATTRKERLDEILKERQQRP